MANEVKLRPGWLIEDVREASERLSQWAKPRDGRDHMTSDQKSNRASPANDLSSGKRSAKDDRQLPK